MKTAEEWAKEIKPGATRQIDLGNGQSVTGPGLMSQSVDPFSLVEIIRSAQRDAIEFAFGQMERRVMARWPNAQEAASIRDLLPPDEASK